ncbi:MAG TPA: hypothetical protein ENJ87_06775 [Gammaproteobacteria bacterium]|nr:hypothetical protein [Gammaproteobacteria bacterium]
MKRTNIKIERKAAFINDIPEQVSQVAPLLIEARKYFDDKQWVQANCLYQQVIDIDSKNITALNDLGLIAMEMGMLSLAVDFFTMANEVDARDLSINKNLAVAYTRMSRFTDAILQYICILDIDENNLDAHGELARLNLEAGNMELALHHCRYALEMNPEDAKNLRGIVVPDPTTLSVDTVEK